MILSSKLPYKDNILFSISQIQWTIGHFMSFCVDTPSYRVDISKHYQSHTKTFHFISILVAKFLPSLTQPSSFIRAWDLQVAMLKHHRHPNIGRVPSLKPSLDTKYFLWNSRKILWFCKIHWFSVFDR